MTEPEKTKEPFANMGEDDLRKAAATLKAEVKAIDADIEASNEQRKSKNKQLRAIVNRLENIALDKLNAE